MSQSPASSTPLDREHPYLKSFDALGQMIARGRSFSGHERNCFFLNTGDGRFSEIAPAIGFDLIDDGRSIGVADWDGDGDLDLWLNARTGPRVRYVQNSLQRDPRARFLAVRLSGTRHNRDAIGARVTVVFRGQAGSRQRLIKTVRAGEGFLTQSSRWLHFGLGGASEIERVKIDWPRGSSNDLPLHQQLESLELDHRYHIHQPDGNHPHGIVELSTPRRLPVDRAQDDRETDRGGQLIKHETTDASSRAFLTYRKAAPNTPYLSVDGKLRSIQSQHSSAQLVTLWATWCPHCLEELTQLSANERLLRAADVDCLAICVDDLLDPSGTATRPATTLADSASATLAELNWPYRGGVATRQFAARLLQQYHQAIYPEHPLTLPFSVLIDNQGKIAAFYRGKIGVEQILLDAHALDGSAEAIAQAAFPFAGRIATANFAQDDYGIAVAQFEAGRLTEAQTLFNTVRARFDNQTSPSLRFDTYRMLGTIATQLGEHANAVEVYREALQAMPRQAGFRLALAKAYGDAGNTARGVKLLNEWIQPKTNDGRLLNQIGLAFESLKALPEAIAAYEQAIQLGDSPLSVRSNLAAALQADGQAERAIAEYRKILASSPDAMDVQNNLAWLLATARDPQLRRPAEAVQLAEAVVEADGSTDAATLDTLSIAYAANDQTDRALAVAERALTLAETRRLTALAARLKARIEQWRLP